MRATSSATSTATSSATSRATTRATCPVPCRVTSQVPSRGPCRVAVHIPVRVPSRSTRQVTLRPTCGASWGSTRRVATCAGARFKSPNPEMESHEAPSAAPKAATKPDVTADVADDASSSKRLSTDYADCPERTRNSERKTADERRWTQIESRIEDCQSSGRTQPDSWVAAGVIYRWLPGTWRPRDRGGGEKQRREDDDLARL